MIPKIKSDYLSNSINQSVFVMDMSYIFCEVFPLSCKINPDVNKEERQPSSVLHMIGQDRSQSQEIVPFLKTPLCHILPKELYMSPYSETRLTL
jgi:hypothetical protein